MAEEDDTEKSHEPTQHKLDEARKKGELVRSADVTTAASYGGIVLAAISIGASSIEQVGGAMMVLIDQANPLADLVFEGQGSAALGGLMREVSFGLGGWFLIPATIALLSVIGTRSFVVAATKIKPKGSRVNPIMNAKNKYGPSGLFEFAKSFAKLILYSVLLGLFIKFRLSEMIGSVHSDPMIVGHLLVRLLVEFMAIVFLIAITIGAVDYLWQRYDHLRKNRMSFQEIREEHKKHEGDPHMKQERRQRASQIASEQMMSDVPKADVVIVNPTHYAVALKWSREPGSAPTCVAKGVDHVAHKIREIAFENGIPVRQDPPTARALHASTDIGDEIAPEHYRPVAAAIKFAETMRRRARSFGA